MNESKANTKRISLPTLSTAVLLVVSIAWAGTGCGRRDLGGVVGRVVQGGQARGFQPPESMIIRFASQSADSPRLFSATVRGDATFRGDLNDGSGRGIPEGRYTVSIDVDGLLIKDPTQKSIPELLADGEPNPDARYPRPGRELRATLSKASCSIEVLRGRTLSLLVDLDQGAISSQSQ
jgi:hypothetical protein